MVPVLVQLHERPVSGNAGHTERLSHWFEGPDHESAGLFLDVDAVVGVAQHRQARGQIGDRFGHQIEVLTGVQRNVDSHVTAQLVGPHAGRGDHVLGIDGSLIGIDANRLAIGGADVFDGHALEDPGAPLLGHVDHGHGGVHWRGLTISG